MQLPLFFVLGAFVLVLALAAPLYSLVLADLVFVYFQGEWHVGGLRLDASDLVFFALGLALVLRGRRSAKAQRSIPHFRLWLSLGVLLSLAYLTAPVNRAFLEDPVRIAYQLYRYCWKTILYFPLAAVLLQGQSQVRAALVAIVLAGDVCALDSIVEGYRGLEATGPFASANGLGAVLLLPTLTALASFLTLSRGRERLFFGASLVLLARALLFAGSRGALVGVFVGAIFIFWQVSRRHGGRARILRLVPWVLAVLLLAPILKPGLLERPSIQRFLTLTDPLEEHTLQWRMTERWPHFWDLVTDHPLLGTGTHVDTSLGERANTPHNGYLSLAMISGLPVLGIYLYFLLASIRRGRRLFRRGATPFESTLGLVAGAGMLGILVHNIVDSTLLIPFVRNLFWLFAALAARGLMAPAEEAAPAPRAPA